MSDLMGCSRCYGEARPGEGLRAETCTRCGKLSFFCKRCREDVCADCAEVVKLNAVRGPELDPLRKPWPVEAAGCPGCVLEMRTGNPAEVGVHLCGGPEAVHDEVEALLEADDAPAGGPPAAPPAAAPPVTDPAPSDARAGRRKRRTGPEAAAREWARREAYNERRRAGRAVERDREWVGTVKAIFEHEAKLHSAWAMPFSEVHELTRRLSELVRQKTALLRRYKCSATPTPPAVERTKP